MKSNVDLTENGIFSSPNRGILKIIAMFEDYLPWDMEHKPHEMRDFANDNEWRTFKSGSREDRKKFKEWEGIENQYVCDRCGRSLTNIPWKRYYGLCDECEKELHEELKKDWRYEEQDEFQGNDLNRFFAK